VRPYQRYVCKIFELQPPELRSRYVEGMCGCRLPTLPTSTVRYVIDGSTFDDYTGAHRLSIHQTLVSFYPH